MARRTVIERLHKLMKFDYGDARLTKRDNAAFQARMANGIVEGFNNKLRMIARRAFGFHSPQLLISMLYLCSEGITLDPPLP